VQEGGYDLANVGGAVTATMKVGTETIVYTCCSRARSSAKLPARTLRSHLALDIAAALLHPANPPPAGSLLCAWGPPCVTTALTALNSSLARWCPLPFPQGFCETAVQPEPEAADDAPREDPAAAPEGVSAGESAGAGEGAAGSAGEGDDSSAAREDAGGAAEGASPPSEQPPQPSSEQQAKPQGRPPLAALELPEAGTPQLSPDGPGTALGAALRREVDYSGNRTATHQPLACLQKKICQRTNYFL